MIIGKLQEELKTAMKAGDGERANMVRFILAALYKYEKDKRAGGNSQAILSDDEAVQVLQKEAKRRREAIELYEKGNRAELADREKKELSIIESFLPRGLSEAELDALIDSVIASGASDFSSAMKKVMGAAGGRADGKTVSEKLKKRFSK